MPKLIDLTGQKFGRLIAIKRIGSNKRKQSLWECLCVCGNISIVICGNLRNGHTQSCGCLHKEVIKESHTKHGMSYTQEYSAWSEMLKRCNNTNSTRYEYYGGRGITVCDRWLKFENFFEDMGLKPDGLTIERINNELGYFKENCEWATMVEQARNRRIRKDNSLGITGVYWNKSCEKYQVSITTNDKQTHIGYFDTLEQAKEARLKAEQEYWL